MKSDINADPKNPALVAKADADTCILCGTCEETCQAGAISADMGVEVNMDKCLGSGECVRACPSGALSLVDRQ